MAVPLTPANLGLGVCFVKVIIAMARFVGNCPKPVGCSLLRRWQLLYRQVGRWHLFKCGSYPQQRRGLVAYSPFAVSTGRAALVEYGSSPNRHSIKKRPSSWR